MNTDAIVAERGKSYGPPALNHGTTAAYWRIAVKRRYGIDVPFDALDVCQFNRLQKESRLGETPTHRDSLADIGGYSTNALMCLESDHSEAIARASDPFAARNSTSSCEPTADYGSPSVGGVGMTAD